MAGRIQRLVCLLLFLSTTAVAEPAALRIVLGADSHGDQCQGPLAALLHELLVVRSGITYVCDSAPWARAQTLVREHKRDALITTRNAERERYLLATRIALIEASLRLYTRHDHPRLPELKQIRTPIEASPFQILSYRGDSWAAQHLISAGLPVDWSKDSSTVLKKLAAGRGDLYFQNSYNTNRLIRQLKLQDQIIALPTTFGSISRYLQIDRDSVFANQIGRINDALAAMQADGSLKRLQNPLQE